MRHLLLLWLLLVSVAFADRVRIDTFESDLFSSQTKGLQKIKLALIFEGRDLKEERYKILDALNVVISSFYIETLFTSKGKERFKSVLTSYLEKKYGVEVDAIYLQSIVRTEHSDLKAFADLLDKRGCCTSFKKSSFTPSLPRRSPITPQPPQIIQPQE